MSDVLAWARRIQSPHVLFLFHSCFSGTVFKAKTLPAVPRHIADHTAKPVRQFISAGSAGQVVPAKSDFTPHFNRALKGAGDLDGDGYVTGTELVPDLNIGRRWPPLMMFRFPSRSRQWLFGLSSRSADSQAL